MRTIIAFLLHCANRNIKGKSTKYIDAFYQIKDTILRKYGTSDGYDVQKIPGKKCRSCGGKGVHPKYSWATGKIYDYSDCYHCWGGWFKFPKWICLQRIKFSNYTFHSPLKREECINNPFTKETIGWEASERPIIEGYIEHEKQSFGDWAIIILFSLYGQRDMSLKFLSDKYLWWRRRIQWKLQKLRTWSAYVFYNPKVMVKSYYDDKFEIEDELPF